MSNMNRNLIFCTLFIIVGCNGTKQDDIAFVTNFEDYETAEDDLEPEKQLYIEIITDSEEVALIDLRIQGAEAERQRKNRIGQRYSLGDESVRNEIIEIFENEETAAKKILLGDLSPNYVDERLIKDEQVMNAILSNLEKPSLEKIIIDFVTEKDFPRYPERFEKRLLTGNSIRSEDLLYWIGFDGKSMPALNYIADEVQNKEVGSAALSRIFDALVNFKENGDDRIRKKVADLCFLIYDMELIPEEEFVSIERDFSYGNPAKQLLNLIFDTEDERAMPIALEYQNNEIMSDQAFAYLVKMEGEKHRKKVIELMKTEADYFKGLELVSDIYNETKDERILISALVNFELLFESYEHDYDDYEGWNYIQLSNEFYECIGDSSENFYRAHVTNKVMLDNLLDLNQTTASSPLDITNYLVETGLTTEKVTTSGINSETGDYDLIYEILERAHIYFSVDLENEGPLDNFAGTLYYFKNNANGSLADLKMNIQFSKDEAEDAEFIAVYGKKAYRMYLPSAQVHNYECLIKIAYFINFILAHQGIDKQFTEITYADFVFGTEAATADLIQTFDLDYAE